MTLEKALKILTDYIGTGPEAEPVDFDEACRLGSEALKKIEVERHYAIHHFERLLPGETS